MDHPTILDCNDPQCVKAPFWLRDAVAASVHQCPLCHYNVYDCGTGRRPSDWHRVTPPSEDHFNHDISVGDMVEIVDGNLEGLGGSVKDLNLSDQMARVMMQVGLTFFPMWIKVSRLRLEKSKH